MKSIILKTIIACAALLPFSVTQAGQFGPFNAGDKLVVEITGKESFKTSLSGNVVNVPVPAGLPKFNVGRKETFTIGKRGELKGRGFSLPFFAAGSTNDIASYTNATRGNRNPATAQIFISVGSNSETFGTLQFTKFTLRGRTPTIYTVAYAFDKK
jgi:hypothetical protein